MPIKYLLSWGFRAAIYGGNILPANNFEKSMILYFWDFLMKLHPPQTYRSVKRDFRDHFSQRSLSAK